VFLPPPVRHPNCTGALLWHPDRASTALRAVLDVAADVIPVPMIGDASAS